MSQQLINHSPDLLRLQNEGYAIEIRPGFLIVHDIPYVTPTGQVGTGTIVSDLSLSGDRTTRPKNHVVYFVGQCPCDQHGVEITRIIASRDPQVLDCGISAQFSFSSKPPDGYSDYYAKITTYVAV